MTADRVPGAARRGRWRRRATVLAGGIAMAASAFVAASAAAVAPARAHPGRRAPIGGALEQARSGESGPTTLAIAGRLLTRCASSPVAYCGRMLVPLDRLSPKRSPRIAIAFRFYPASNPPGGVARGTVVPVEGGPGYPSIGSVAEGYAGMYGPVLERWNMLVVDNRGTGSSTVIDCPALQYFSQPTASDAYRRAAAQCAASLNDRWRYADGARVHASDLFTTAPAAQDMAEVIAALRLAPVDLYGDSYGSWFSQAFASRYPSMVRSLILDSTYSTVAIDPWYRSSVESMPADFDAACERWPSCANAAPGSAWARVGEVARRLREAPLAAVVPGPAGRRERVSMGVVGLVDLINDAAGDLQIYRELDAADRALLEDGDAAPLLRLYAQRLAVDEAFASEAARKDSAGLYLAVGCLDYEQLFSMTVSPPTREGELAAAEAALPASTFSPFTTAEWLQQNQNTEAYSACLKWPAPRSAQPPIDRVPRLLPASLPVLVLGGEFDTLTPPVDHPKILAELGGKARFIEVANSTHVVGETDTLCGSLLVRRLVERPDAIDSIDASCAVAAPPVHAVGSYPDSLAGEPPIDPDGGTHASVDALRLAAAALETAADALAREQAISYALDEGLRGGTVTATRGGTGLTLHADELIPGVPVSGTVSSSPAADPLNGEAATARLTVPSAVLTAHWTTSGAGAIATVTGTVAGERVAGTAPAP